MHQNNSSVKGRSGGPSIAVVSKGSNSDLFSRSDAEVGQLRHRDSAGLDVDISSAEGTEVGAVSTSGSGAYFNSVVSDGSTTIVSGSSPGDLDGALDSLDADERSLRLGSESDFESSRSSVSTAGSALDVESVDSAVSNGD